MTAAAGDPAILPIEDVQARADVRRIPIDHVGVKDVRHPVRLEDRTAGEQHTIATFNMYVSLPQGLKGTHMSRFLEVLHLEERAISVDSLREMLAAMTARLEADAGRIEISFPFFVMKRAPVSGVESLMDYRVTLTAERRAGRVGTWIRVVVPVTSLCPCSKEISSYGAHNQRSHITLTVEAASRIWIEELIEIAESEASSELYGILKRPDEKHVTERAYENPKFVEDIVRDVAGRLDRDPRVAAYVVEAENFESIHNHSAYARIERKNERPSDRPPSARGSR
ncbi:MAG: GTP cyclohydrolase FolE2 [Steroidobacteraceae bacterium]